MRYTNPVSENSASWHAWVVSAAFVVPLSFSAASFASKPIDITLSDVWLFVFIFIFLMKVALTHRPNYIASKTVIAIASIPIFYFLVLGMIGGIVNDSPLSNIISATRFAKQFAFIIIGWQIFRVYRQSIIQPFLVTCILTQIVLIASDFFWGDFPLGCGVESRWGGCFVEAEVYGFPNSSASFQVLLTGLMLAITYSLGHAKKLFFVITALGLMLALFSLSRAAWVYAGWLVLWLWISFLNGRQKLFSILLLIPMIFELIDYIGNTDITIFDGIFAKLARSVSDDPSSGRFSIWIDAVELISSQPIFGYKFDFFSDYVGDFDTPHNQYLEVVFKSGLVGLFIYGFTIYLLWRLISSKQLKISKPVQYFLKWGVLVGLLLNGLFQPIFSYSMVSNLIMMLIGYALSASEFKSSAYKHETTSAKSR